jgi:HD-GYP domain-containing protein (c-di-GMP phosphodiesterase class II)
MVSLTEEMYFPIQLSYLLIDSIRSFDVFIKVKGKMVLYHSGSDRFTSEVRDNLLENNITVLYIKKTDREVYNRYLEENLVTILQESKIGVAEKAEIAHESVNSIAKSLFEAPRAQTITRYKSIISTTMDFIMKEEDAITNLIKLTSHDFATYIHSVNVGIFAIGLAKELLKSHKGHNMKELAAGFFLHDIGKCAIPLTVLNKRGPLTTYEWEIMRKHPYEGYKLLEKYNSLTDEAKYIVMEHHERHDGRGYPRKLQGGQIHLYSKICCIADVFDALTSRRPYKKPHTSFHALQIMKNEMYDEFDPDFFSKFVFLFSNVKSQPT